MAAAAPLGSTTSALALSASSTKSAVLLLLATALLIKLVSLPVRGLLLLLSF
jgi:hypothetical protein